MGGYCYGEPEPTEACPYCKTVCHADYVDVGVAMVQCGPFHCVACGASEIGPCDKERELSAAETRNGWYAPGQDAGSSANVLGGKIVGYREMQDAYAAEFTGNPLWHVDGSVDEWFEAVRVPA